MYTAINSAYANIINGDGTSTGGGKALCTMLPQSSYQYSTNNIEHFYFYKRSGSANVFIDNTIDVDTVIANLKVIGTLSTPIITPLTDEQIDAIKALQSYKNATTIYNSDKAYTRVDYVADTKAYIDSKLEEILARLTV